MIAVQPQLFPMPEPTTPDPLDPIRAELWDGLRVANVARQWHELEGDDPDTIAYYRGLAAGYAHALKLTGVPAQDLEATRSDS